VNGLIAFTILGLKSVALMQKGRYELTFEYRSNGSLEKGATEMYV
jgi:hypothetical protein